jgi:phosphopantothenoylcysteine decarboxylase / phosphopantothenate---cysteine ligase
MRVVLGVTGGVAAYKAAELVRRLQQERLEVQVVMTRHAQEFVAPLTFAALTGQKVITTMFGDDSSASLDSAIEHIGVAQSLDALVIAPATANTIAKMARGIADDFLTTLYLATKAPVIVAPAMNVNMWDHPATRDNIEVLRARGVRIVSPDEGYLACGMTGNGRLAGIEPIAQTVFDALGIRHDLERDTVLVTAGPTCEDLDPVRYLTNRSSGKMGYAVADAALRRGARVILISGPTKLDVPEHVERISVRSTEEMHRAVLAHLSPATIVVMAAAVADYRPVAQQGGKIKRASARLTLELEATPDILADISAIAGDRILVGFAAETGAVAENARQKLVSKSVDLIVANDVTAEGAGFDHDTNVVTVYARDGREMPLPRMPKLEVAHRLLDLAVDLRRSRRGAEARSAAPNPGQ